MNRRRPTSLAALLALLFAVAQAVLPSVHLLAHADERPSECAACDEGVRVPHTRDPGELKAPHECSTCAIVRSARESGDPGLFGACFVAPTLCAGAAEVPPADEPVLPLRLCDSPTRGPPAAC